MTPEVKKALSDLEKNLESELQKAFEKLTKEEEISIYDPKGRRSPFKSLVQIQKPETKDKKIIGTLESYDVTDFKLIAVAKRGGEMYGLLRAPDNRAYTATKGTVLGLHKGKVKQISQNKLVIIEYKEDYKGELKPTEVVLELRQGEEGE
jgi:type IV pilus assembly protein PilP